MFASVDEVVFEAFGSGLAERAFVGIANGTALGAAGFFRGRAGLDKPARLRDAQFPISLMALGKMQERDLFRVPH